MTTRPRGSGGGGGGGGGGSTTPPNRTQQGSIWPTFEDFRPTSEWKQDNESHILTIDLPGFAKEQLRVSTEGREVIRVRGERLVSGNKWSRFHEDYKVHINSDMNAVRAKFQAGILTITVRKKDADIPHDVRPPETTPSGAPKQSAPLKDRVGSPQPPAVAETARLRPEEPLGGLPDVLKDERNTSPIRDAGIILGERKEPDMLKEKYAGTDRSDDATQKMVEKKEVHAETSEKLPAEVAAKKISKRTPDGAPITKDGNENNKKSKAKHTPHSTAAEYGVLAVEKYYKKAVRGYGELNEERKLLVNMGVAVLVVMAVTAYATYKFTALPKDQN